MPPYSTYIYTPLNIHLTFSDFLDVISCEYLCYDEYKSNIHNYPRLNSHILSYATDHLPRSTSLILLFKYHNTEEDKYLIDWWVIIGVEYDLVGSSYSVLVIVDWCEL